jgi:hypothetical protein
MESSGLKIIGPEVIERETKKIKQAVIRVERPLVSAIDTQILGKDVEKLAEFLLCLLAIFKADHVHVPATDTPKRGCVLLGVSFLRSFAPGKGAGTLLSATSYTTRMIETGFAGLL